MAKIRIHEIAKELGSSSKKILEKAKELGFAVTTVSSAVSPEDAAKLYDYVQSGITPETKPAKKSSPKQLAKKEIKPVSTAQDEPNKMSKIKPKEQDESKQEPKEQTLANSSLNKRRGLVIVKKKKDEQPQPKDEKPSSLVVNKTLESMFGSSDESLKKKKKDKKQFHATKKESSSKLDLMELSEFGDDIVIDDENVVILPDLTLKPIEVERQQTIKKPLNVYKQSQNSGFNLDGGIQRSSRKKHKKLPKDNQNESVTSVNIPKEIRVYEFADKIKKSPSEIIGKLFMLGKMTTKNDFLEEDEIEILGAEFGIEINIVDTQEEFDYVKAYEGEDDQHSEPRAPVVTIMGHVDHGKTSLLDYIQNSRVASGEAGGITQHVGAYMVEKNGKNITFIDTPGHEAFTAMRARGASVTDIVIIVVAADDGVKPQTKEAISHAKAAGVPIIIAINKMDKESANPDLVKTGLAELDIMPTEWGGSHEFVPVSAKTGMGIEDLLEIVLLQAEILELKANPNREAKATIIESSLQKGRGPVATVIVENGTLKVGDTIVAGVAYGKVRALNDDKGRSLKAIKPGECGVLIGLSEVPEAGETLISVKSDKEAREYAQKKYEYLRQKELSKSTKVTIDELSAKIAEGELKNLPVIIKADVQGSLEAIKASLEKLRNDEIKVNIIHSGVGGITQSDISLASASQNCVILGFNIRPTGEIKEKAKEKGVEIKTYNVIYNLLDDVKALLSGLMSPVITEEDLGQAVIRQVINVPKVGQIAGCMVTEGIISRGAKIRVIRDGVVVFEGNISSLKRFKDDAKEVAKGYECGVGIEGYNDMRQGDYIESYKEVENRAQI
ncbi:MULTISPECIES: translation initiation factor IF-2 [Campylobacter]|uniref:translation initiation factor IF-2 n=1 Tax=Campylobacter TaxID=194 RepID=UPI000A339DD2|nr:translation initiation factor IF-2 [Campylobacter sp. P0124]MCR8696006.1 translation initiation factor IF-2 [Campylobacter sp. RM19073]